MHRDLKIGLSLGVLLVGVVGAFFFRREPLEAPQAPELVSAEELDAQIAEKPRIPYLTGVEFEKPQPAAAPARPRLTQEPPPTQFQLPDFLAEEDSALQKAQLARRSSAPDPISSPADSTAGANIVAGPAHNRVWQTSSSSRQGTTITPASTQVPGPRTHVIQSGDTLSGLASRYLGSSARYDEIYQANRDVLPNPNRLPLGVTITIPEENASTRPQSWLTSSSREVSDTIIEDSGIAVVDPFSNLPDRPLADDKPAAKPAAAPVNDPVATLRGTITEVTPVAVTPDTKGAPPTEASNPPDAPEANGTTRRFVSPKRVPFASGPLANFFRTEPEDLGVGRSTLEAPEPTARRSYTVRRGDSLSRIAMRIYGDVTRAEDIFAANRHQLRTPNEIREGMQLILP